MRETTEARSYAQKWAPPEKSTLPAVSQAGRQPSNERRRVKMKRLAVLIAACGALILATSGAALGKGGPQGPVKNGWFCVLDLGTWHCASPGVLANLGGPSGPSLNWECNDPAEYEPGGICGEPYGQVSFGPPEGTVFVGTEQLIRIDVYGGQPCPQGSSGFVDLGVAVYWFCHHYEHLAGHP